MSKTVSSTTESYAWDALSNSLLVDGSTSFVYGPDGAPLEQINGTTVLYYLHDQLGSTRVLTNSSGTAVATYTYDPYGNLLGSTGSVLTPLTFAGAYTDSETGFLYLINRYYDPATGQFLSVDPAVSLTQSAYSYANGDPVNGIDTLGLGFCFFGTSPDGACRGSGLVRAIVTNPIVQTIATVGVCTFSAGTLCYVVVGGFLAVNEYYAYQRNIQEGCGGWTGFAEDSSLNVLSAVVQGDALPASGIVGFQTRLGSNEITMPFYKASDLPLGMQVRSVLTNLFISGTANGISWGTQKVS
jgi:RHS repeat-associated protein